MHHPLPIALLLTVALGVGCDETRQQVCAPGAADRCAEGETCAVDNEGTPRCVMPGAAVEGDLCRVVALDGGVPGASAPDDDPTTRCASGLGCLRVAGVSRCLRFCDPAVDPDPCRPEGPMVAAPNAAQARLRDHARCVGVLPDRPEIGVCLLPCRPDRQIGCSSPGVCVAFPDDCPSGTVCGLAPSGPVPVCVPAATANPGESGAPCDPIEPCAAGLLCTRIDGASRCRLATDVAGGCPEGQRAEPLAGVSEPLGELISVERVCLPVPR